jgi:hypothetical protein
VYLHEQPPLCPNHTSIIHSPTLINQIVMKFFNSVVRSVVMLTLFFLSFSIKPLQAQGYEPYKNGLRLYLNNKDSTSFIRLLMWSQIWARMQEHNPYTTINTNNNVDQTWDVGIRRSRILLHGQLNPRILVFWIIGANNQTFNTGGGGLLTGPDGVTDGKRQSVFVHDAWTEFKVSREFSFGAGLLTWSGLSRQSNAATLNFLTLDSPLYGWSILDATDQFARTFGLYAKGEIGKLSYRAVLTKPFTMPIAAAGWQTMGRDERSAAVQPTFVNGRGGGWTAGLIGLPNAYNISQWSGRTLNEPMYQLYSSYDFWEQESQTLPFMVGSYLGTKKVLNIGAGFIHQSNAMWARQIKGGTPTVPAGVTLNADQTRQLVEERRFPTAITGWSALPLESRRAIGEANIDTVNQDMTHFSVDAFMELPMGKGENQSSISAYAAQFWFNYGSNYVRNAGTMNIANGTSPVPTGQAAPFNGPGTGYPTWGTGSVSHLQVGYLFPQKWTKGFGRLQPYMSVSHVNFDRLNEPHTLIEGGVNWILAGQNAKISLHYRPRPIYTAATTETPGQELLGGMRLDGTRNELITQFFIYF